VPSAEVITAPRVYIKVFAIKTLVVYFFTHTHFQQWHLLSGIVGCVCGDRDIVSRIVFRYMIRLDYRDYFE
jgi:hypothetical protein